MIGIYIIENIVNGKRYVGQSIDIDIRWAAHRRDPQPKMRADVEKYGWDAFKFDVLEECPREKLTERENYYIKLLKPEYNTVIRGYKRLPSTCRKISVALMGHTVTKEAREKMSRKRLGMKIQSPEHVEKLRQKSFGNKSRSRAVVCMETNIEYPSAKAAAKALGLASSSGITSVLAGRSLSAGGCHWRYADEDADTGSTTRDIEIICEETGERFPSIEAAARHYNLNPSTIWKILYGKSISVSYHWKFANDERKCNTIRHEDSRKNYTPTPVFCLETGETYSSIRQAAKALGISTTKISYILNGNNKRDCNYHFEYVGEPTQPAACVDRKIPHNTPIRRRIVCLETGEEFESISQAGRKLNLDSNHIGDVVRGDRKTVGGLHFKALDNISDNVSDDLFGGLY